MSDLTNVFTDIADAIRAKTETQITYKPIEMANAINNISVGSEVVVTTGSLQNDFNTPVTIANGVVELYNCFRNFTAFNQPVTFPSSAIIFEDTFSGCKSYNQPVTFPNSAMAITNCFRECISFNQPIVIPNSVGYSMGCFYNCSNFNQTVVFSPEFAQSSWADNIFFGCRNLNSPVIFPFNISYGSTTGSTPLLSNVFGNCSNFNQMVTIPYMVSLLNDTFNNCVKFNQHLCINSAGLLQNAAYMLCNCKNFGSNIYISDVDDSLLFNCRGMFNNCNTSKTKRIICYNAQPFLGTTYTNSVTGGAIVWTHNNNTYFNTAYNIYIHEGTKPIAVLDNASYYMGQGLVSVISEEIGEARAVQFTDNVRNLRDAFSYAHSLNMANITIFLSEGVTDMRDCFAYRDDFNQPLTIPSSVQTAEECLVGCLNFNSPVVIRNGVEQLYGFLTSCQNFDADIWIPESVTNMLEMFLGCDAFNAVNSGAGKVHISHNIALGDTNNYIYNSLINEEAGMVIPAARILNDY